jgi:hypothetical protein
VIGRQSAVSSGIARLLVAPRAVVVVHSSRHDDAARLRARTVEPCRCYAIVAPSASAAPRAQPDAVLDGAPVVLGADAEVERLNGQCHPAEDGSKATLYGPGPPSIRETPARLHCHAS